MTQIGILADELNVLKTAFIGVKSSHANMHQASVNQASASTQQFTDHAARLGALEGLVKQAGGDLANVAKKGSYKKPLIKPEQIEVKTFTG